MSMSHGYEHTSPEEILEHEDERVPETIVPVPVAVDGLVQTQRVGASSWSANNYSVTSTTPVQIAQPQAARSYMLIESSGVAYIGRSESEARGKTGYKLGVAAGNEQFPMRHREEVWAMADSGTVTISVYQEFWSN
jgi:hypothetical protein